MTIALGVLAAGGRAAVLVSDSMTVSLGPDGQVKDVNLTADGKHGHTEDMAWALSGRWPRAYRPVPPPADSLQDRARGYLAELDRLAAPPCDGPMLHARASGTLVRARVGAMHLIAASVPAGSMVYVGNEDPAAEIGPEGGVLVRGAGRAWIEEHHELAHIRPATLGEAEEVAVGLARSYVEHCYGGRSLAGMALLGELPVVAYPLAVYSIDLAGIRDWRYQP